MELIIGHVQTPKYPASGGGGGGNKRKMPDNPTPEMLKKMRMEVSSVAVPTPESPEPSPKGKQRATVEDAEDEDAPDNDDFAPGGDADYFAEEDEEGRFYGGGLTSEQKDIMNIFDRAGGEGIQDDVRPPSVFVFTCSSLMDGSQTSCL